MANKFKVRYKLASELTAREWIRTLGLKRCIRALLTTARWELTHLFKKDRWDLSHLFFLFKHINVYIENLHIFDII